MLKTLTDDTSIPDMINALSSDGVFKIDNYLSGEILQKLHDDVLDRCTNEAGYYEFGRNYRGEGIFTYPINGPIFQVYTNPWMQELHAQYTGSTNQYGMNVFATHDYKYEGELARNGRMHFDRHWRLKFFIYLTDIDKSSGAFSCSVGSRGKGSELRQIGWHDLHNGKYDSVRNRIELDYPELLDQYSCEPVEAPAGTLIVFDTDTFHMGGKCDEGKERLIVRLHCG